jgi:tetratricopeptide (TPR) repeat protein
MLPTHEPTKKEQILNTISSFISKFRWVLISLLGIFIIVLVTILIVTEVRKNRSEKSLVQVERLRDDYDAWKEMEDDEEKTGLEKDIIERADHIINTYGNYYAAQRALLIKGLVSYEKEEYKQAADYFTKLADTYTQSHLARVGLFNAATAYEELEDYDTAIEAHSKLIERYSGETPDIARSLFNIGRLYELKQEFAQARENYNRLIDNYGSSDWTKMARNRIIYFDAEGVAAEE